MPWPRRGVVRGLLVSWEDVGAACRPPGGMCGGRDVAGRRIRRPYKPTKGGNFLRWGQDPTLQADAKSRVPVGRVPWPRRGILWGVLVFGDPTGISRAALSRARVPRIRRRPLGRAAASATRGPAPAPCIRRRRRSPAQQFLVRRPKPHPVKGLLPLTLRESPGRFIFCAPQT